MHTSDSIFLASSPKNVSHQSHLFGLWRHLMVQCGCLANPLKKSLFSRCVNPIAECRAGQRLALAQSGTSQVREVPRAKPAVGSYRSPRDCVPCSGEIEAF